MENGQHGCSVVLSAEGIYTIHPLLPTVLRRDVGRFYGHVKVPAPHIQRRDIRLLVAVTNQHLRACRQPVENLLDAERHPLLHRLLSQLPNTFYQITEKEKPAPQLPVPMFHHTGSWVIAQYARSVKELANVHLEDRLVCREAGL
jgi:hypothetical protein